MSEFGTLCANARYRASLLIKEIKQCEDKHTISSQKTQKIILVKFTKKTVLFNIFPTVI